MHVYTIKCEQNGKKYVGSSISDDLDTRIRRHRHDLAAGSHGNSYMQYAWNRHGADSFSFEVVEIVDYDETKTRKENEIMIRRLEDEWIVKENCLTPNGFNCVTAELCVPTQETREKMSEAQRKRPPPTAETRKKISKIHKGRIFSEETKRRISEAHKGEKSYWYGKKQTDETRNKRSASMKGRIITDEHREKLRQANLEQQKVECPHCGKQGNPSPMSRWHFERCRSLRSSE